MGNILSNPNNTNGHDERSRHIQGILENVSLQKILEGVGDFLAAQSISERDRRQRHNDRHNERRQEGATRPETRGEREARTGAGRNQGYPQDQHPSQPRREGSRPRHQRNKYRSNSSNIPYSTPPPRGPFHQASPRNRNQPDPIFYQEQPYPPHPGTIPRRHSRYTNVPNSSHNSSNPEVPYPKNKHSSRRRQASIPRQYYSPNEEPGDRGGRQRGYGGLGGDYGEFNEDEIPGERFGGTSERYGPREGDR